MKLIIAIVQDEDASRLVSNLMNEGYGVTKLATTGGFLRAGNTTLLVGVATISSMALWPLSKRFARAASRWLLRPLPWRALPACMYRIPLRLWSAALPYSY